MSTLRSRLSALAKRLAARREVPPPDPIEVYVFEDADGHLLPGHQAALDRAGAITTARWAAWRATVGRPQAEPCPIKTILLRSVYPPPPVPVDAAGRPLMEVIGADDPPSALARRLATGRPAIVVDDVLLDDDAPAGGAPAGD